MFISKNLWSTENPTKPEDKVVQNEYLQADHKNQNENFFFTIFSLFELTHQHRPTFHQPKEAIEKEKIIENFFDGFNLLLLFRSSTIFWLSRQNSFFSHEVYRYFIAFSFLLFADEFRCAFLLPLKSDDISLTWYWWNVMRLNQLIE